MSEIKDLYIEQKNKYDSYLAELDGVERRLKAYRDGLSSVIVKTINGNKYYYKQWRDDKKIHSELIGKVEPGAAADTEKEIIERKYLEKREKELKILLKILSTEIEELRKFALEPEIEENFTFEVFWKNELSARVSVRKNKVYVSRYIIHPIRQIFHADEITRNQLMEALKLRCLEEGRPDINEWLKYRGLNSYNPLEIVRKTHGVSYNDYIWIRFPGENLRAEDVLVRERM